MTIGMNPEEAKAAAMATLSSLPISTVKIMLQSGFGHTGTSGGSNGGSGGEKRSKLKIINMKGAF
jgi:hypothetical protein